MNTFGRNLRVTTFGESHGPAIGGVIDGFPSGFKIDFRKIQEEIDKRKPGTSTIVTQRKEDDSPEFLSGISEEGVTLGTPIGFIIRNKDHHSNDYRELAHTYRPNHADYTYDAKYGIRDHRGGGRASARETANWVVAGAFAQQWLAQKGIKVEALLTGVKDIDYSDEIYASLVNNPSDNMALRLPENGIENIEAKILEAKNSGDSIGGKVTCVITGVKPGIGDPVFRKLHATLGQAMLSINAAKGFDYGMGTHLLEYTGTESADCFFTDSTGKIITDTNYSGGIQGGITNGMPIYFSVIFKPTPTVMKDLPTVSYSGQPVKLHMRGRHDPCVAVRGVPVVKAMASLVIADFLI